MVAGKPFNQDSICKWWQELHSSSGAAWPFCTLHEVRAVMVGEVMENPSSMDKEAAAKLMGNSTAVWATHYDRRRGARMIERGAADMEAFRAAQLQASTVEEPKSSRKQMWVDGEGWVSASEEEEEEEEKEKGQPGPVGACGLPDSGDDSDDEEQDGSQ